MIAVTGVLVRRGGDANTRRVTGTKACEDRDRDWIDAATSQRKPGAIRS